VKQQGSGALGMVLMILVMGGISLNASRQMLTQGMALVADEQHFIQQFWQAQSALQWGSSLNWPASAELICQQEHSQGWRSCLRRGSNGQALLKGEASGSEMALWQWVATQGSRIEALPHGWIDFCPLAKAEQCP
jgi:hypothetical protein